MPKNCFIHNIKYFSKYLNICSRCLLENDENKIILCNNEFDLNFCQFIIKELKLQGEYSSVAIKQCIHCKIYTIPNGNGTYICPGIPLQVYNCNLCKNENNNMICCHLSRNNILKQKTNCDFEYCELSNNFKCRNCHIQAPLKIKHLLKKSLIKCKEGDAFISGIKYSKFITTERYLCLLNNY